MGKSKAREKKNLEKIMQLFNTFGFIYTFTVFLTLMVNLADPIPLSLVRDKHQNAR